ncbi:right-handed parallel beta-helix repeat-containing protein [Erythrobacter sp. SCSIO 43205]|uniref:parallel beta-helix domain-containing protein n=1 Tax=Erythrobacter sp. SCSIO 43205 TaxID=2779361 RepID=UPI001CA8E50F|nr:parallel beta-helix domain-containing protein [Erythrobacter sp. SCSIO 43205]UAB79439.1 right-handed parallel beta-helix repeat-containing protein [Erythrobacter sp. SCSIO 43205]
MMRLTATALLLASAAPVWAETHTISPGEGAQERLQEALILAEPGDEIVLEAGRYTLTDGLSLDVDGVTVRGAGMDGTVLDFTAQEGSGEGLLVTSDNVTLRDFALENPKGDGIKSKGADNIVYYRIRVTWTGGPKPTNGAYGIYPVESTGVLVSHSEVSGASDAGIYVGQSSKITVRHSIASDNVAGIEIENSRDAVVSQNFVTRNTGGILVFDLPGLPVMGGGNVMIVNNLVVDNDTENFAPPGNIVAGVRRGTGIMVMANENVWIENNIVQRNVTAPFMVIAYTQPYEDERYNPYPREVSISHNITDIGGTNPDFEGGEMLMAAFGGALPPILWDGLSQDENTVALRTIGDVPGWSLNLERQGQSLSEARPGPLDVPAPISLTEADDWGAPAELEARIG